MARPPSILRPVRVHVILPEDLWLRLTTHLFSEAEQRVPHGAYSKFIAERITEYLSQLEPPSATIP